MVKIEIRTENIAGDEELADALRAVLDWLDCGEVCGEFSLNGEDCQFAINPAAPLIGGE